ncbi:DUF6261 family protein [Limibacterium fermenti]|uniref:DUF6261 family protein n=1 Tax=Limibacterium fermenti TaxID=3229863 RepID=UPI003A782F8C
MTLISKKNLDEVPVMDFYQVMTNTDNHYKSVDLETLKLKPTYDEHFAPAYTALDVAVKPLYSNVETKEIWELDKKTDDTIVGLRQHLKSQLRHPDPDVSNAASKLLTLMDNYGKNIYRKPILAEIGIVTNLMQDFAKPEYAPLVTTSASDPWVTKLGEYNGALGVIYNDRTRSKALVEIGQVKKARTKMQKAFTKMADVINALALLEGEAAYKPIADDINEEIKQVLTSAKISRGLKKKGGKTSDGK